MLIPPMNGVALFCYLRGTSTNGEGTQATSWRLELAIGLSYDATYATDITR